MFDELSDWLVWLIFGRSIQQEWIKFRSQGGGDQPKPIEPDIRPGDPRKKIVILGGGVGAMVAAFELTNYDGWQDRYDITLYQLGWRLGGKGASGRNQEKYDRIEEHGLHVWGGFYDNAFRVIQKCYDELNRAEDIPVRTWDEAFIGQDYFYLQEIMPDNSWQSWTFDIPVRDSQPGNPTNPDEPEPINTIWQLIAYVMEEIQKWLEKFLGGSGENVDVDLLHQHFPDFSHIVEAFKQDVNVAVDTSIELVHEFGQWVANKLHGSADSTTPSDHHALLQKIIETLREMVEERLSGEASSDPKVRHLRILINMFFSMLRGMMDDRLYARPFDDINDQDFTQWLASHGGSQEMVDSALIHSLYDLVFAFPQGDMTPQNRNIEAGTMLRTSLRVIRYRGHVIYRMAAGMGDVVFAPLYEVLKRRGVKFKFFHQVENLGVSADGKRIETIQIGRQATIKGGGEYDPLYPVKKLPCWPSDPLYDQLVEGDELKARHINLEAINNGWKDVETITLQADKDYDYVVLGISRGAFPYICQELINRNDAWKNMVNALQTVRTQAFQLWFIPTLAELGWDPDGAIARGQTITNPPLPMVGNVPGTQADTYVAMDQLIQRENFPEDTIGDIAYFTGVMKEDIPLDEALERVKSDAHDFLLTVRKMWHFANKPGSDNDALDWAKLYAPKGTRGLNRLWWQYFRANTEDIPSELYVLTVVNSSKYRLPSGKSGFSNLILAGDWTDSRNNLGMVEGAVMSGMMASRALCGYPVRISGEGDYY